MGDRVTPFVFNTTPSIVCAAGAIRRLGEIAKARLGGRILLVSDPGLATTGLLERAETPLREAGLAVERFTDVVADPPEDVVIAAANAATIFEATGIVGFGGGSSMDVAKLVALLALGRERLADIYGVGNVEGPRLPLALIPTTAGTGSEVTPISIVTTGETEKKGVVSPVLIPDVALLDPELTLGLPPHVTAATGVDAMVHAIEAYTCVNSNKNPVSLALAREALRLLAANIRRVVTDGADVDARGAMLLGSMLAGQAFANSPVGAVHALAYPLGGIYHLPHGLTNALVLPEVLRFNAADPVAAQGYAELAPIVFPTLEREGAQGRVGGFIEGLARLNRELGLPKSIREVGVGEADLPRLAAEAMKQTRLLVNNPRPVEEADALAIYRAAF
jgi:alcohol dehydrogenase class IV